MTTIDLEKEWKEALQNQYDGVQDIYTTNEATAKYEFIGFMAPFALVKDKATGVKGTLEFTHRPRLYFNFKEA